MLLRWYAWRCKLSLSGATIVTLGDVVSKEIGVSSEICIFIYVIEPPAMVFYISLHKLCILFLSVVVTLDIGADV